MSNDNNGLQLKYFILKPSLKDAYGKASLAALEAYEDAIGPTNRALAEDLRLWRARIQARVDSHIAPHF